MNSPLFWSVLLAALAFALPVAAQEEPRPEPVRPSVRRVTLFKNGLAYVEAQVAAPAGSAWVHVVPPSLPLHGSFWVSHDPALLAVREAVAERVKVAEEVLADSIPALLAANVGRDVVLRAGDQEYRGTLIAYPGAGPAPAPTARVLWPGDAEAEPTPGSLVLLRTYRGVVGLNPASVQQVLFEGADATERTRRTREESRLRIRVENAQEGATFLLQYLTHGLAWAPSYRLELAEDGKAQLEARTDVINDSMDLGGVEATLVSGFPNLKFIHVPGALGLRTSLDEFARALAQEGAPAQRREQIMSQSVYSNVAFQAEAGLAATNTQGFEGEAREDMFFSRLGTVTLAKGGRGNWPLFRVAVPCEQIFRWEIADYLNEQGYYRQPQQEQSAPEEVWHSLRLTNETTAPWTTAPITVLKGGSVLGQDVCFYTPSGGRSLVKVTKALNVRAEQQEHELDRKRQAERLYGYEYDLVTVQGTLYLCSYKSSDVTVEISKTLSGDLEKADENPTVIKLGRGLLQVNPVNRLNWRLTLPAGKEVKLTYTYKVLVRR